MNIQVPTVYPTITSYPTYASLLSISDRYLQSNYEDYMNWFILQFVNTIYLEERKYIFFDNVLKQNTVEFCEIVERQIYNGVQMQQFHIDFADFFIEKLQEGYAIFLRINQKYIPELNIQDDFNHEVLITGYNSEEDCFTIWDFFNGHKYDCMKISKLILQQTLTTFQDLNHPDNPNRDKTSKIIAFRPSLNLLITRYEPRLLSFLIERWLTGERVGNRCYGRLCYSLLKKDIECQIERIDLQVLHLLYDHKIALYKTIHYLMHTNKIDYNQELIQNAKQLCNNAAICRNILLKYKHDSKANNLKYKNILTTNLNSLDYLDQKVFTQLYKSLRVNRII